MPHLKSAKKSLRQDAKRRLRNRAAKKTIKLQVKEFLTAVQNKDATPEQLKVELGKAAKKLDKAASKRVIHPNLAARKKSQLARMINKRTPAGSAPAK
jgi:small subunit ribosomal protein S20